MNASDLTNRASIEKLRLTDASFVHEPESSPSFGFGSLRVSGAFAYGDNSERLEREYGLNLILTVPSAGYRIRSAAVRS